MPTGPRLKRSTKTTNRRKATELAQKYERESRARRTAKQARKILAEIYRDLSGEELPVTTARNYFESFIEQKKLEVSPATYAYYNGHSKRFLKWLGPKAASRIANSR